MVFQLYPLLTLSLSLFRIFRSTEVIFRVSDQGIGIPEEDQSVLFEAFHRGKNTENIHGTGLGLTIVKNCVEAHGGIITFSSILGQGTTFDVFISIAGKVSLSINQDRSRHAIKSDDEPEFSEPFYAKILGCIGVKAT